MSLEYQENFDWNQSPEDDFYRRLYNSFSPQMFWDYIPELETQIVSWNTLQKENMRKKNNELPNNKSAWYNPWEIIEGIPKMFELIQTLGIWEKIKEYLKPSDSFAEKSRSSDVVELKPKKETSIFIKNNTPFKKVRLTWFWYEKWTKWLELDVVGILGIARLIEWLLYWNTTELRQRKELPIVKERLK